MSNGNPTGCLVLLGIGFGVAMINKACDKTPPPISQPATGVVAVYQPPAPPVTYQPPVQAEPSQALLWGGYANSRTVIVLQNDMSDAAYIKVLRNGVPHATVYLRPSETYRLPVATGYFGLRYVAGPSNQWRGEEHHFGSSSRYFMGGSQTLDDGDEWTIRLFSRYVRRGAGGPGAPRISREEF